MGREEQIARLDDRELLGERDVEAVERPRAMGQQRGELAAVSEVVVRVSRRSLPISAISIPGNASVSASRIISHEPADGYSERSPEPAGISAIRRRPGSLRSVPADACAAARAAFRQVEPQLLMGDVPRQA